MDSFMEKLAGRFGTSDPIKVNSEAEAKAMDAAKKKIDELEKAVSEMRRLNLKCAETNEATGQLIKSAIEKIEEYRADSSNSGSGDLQEVVNELKSLKESIDSSFKASEEESHKENVRVYRNVQAAVIEELKQQSEAIAIQHSHIESKIRGIKPIAIIALVLSGVTFAATIAAAVLLLIEAGIL